MPPNPKKKRKGNPLLSLPIHLRRKIYQYIFSLTTIFSGRAPTDLVSHLHPECPTRSLSLFVNHQTHTDAENLWISRIEFAFVTERALFNKLDIDVPDYALTQIRYVTNWPLRINEEDVEDWF